MQTGQKLNRYQIVSLLGEGGMGEVYKGYDPLLQRAVAIKVMHPHFARQPNFRERFIQEARTAARLDHPGIVKVHDSGEVNETLYIVMEYIPGANLRKMLDELCGARRWIVLPEGVDIVRQICIALDYAHRQGVLHRDIKPDNIMLKPEPVEELPYHPVLTDLGLAKLTEGLPITRDGETLGTPGYMSPEQTLGLPLDARSDVYSLGILLYELCAGQLPFPARTISEAIRYHTKEPAPPPHKIRSGIPDELEAVILKALSKKPEDRYSKASDLAQAIRASRQPVDKSADARPTEAVVSLVTQYQRSLVEVRGQSVLDEFPPPAPAGQDRITIMEPDKTSRIVVIPPHGLSIGRGPENDIVLNDHKASRRHAKIEIAGVDYRIVDLKSTNGTFLGDVKLLAGVGEVWRPEKALRVGDSWLRLERAAGADSSAGTPLAETFPDLVLPVQGKSPDQAPPVQGKKAADTRIGVSAPETLYKVDPGNSLSLAFTLTNQGQTVDHLLGSLTGLPAQWLTSSPPEVHLMPGEKKEIHFTIQPPRIPQSLAGEYKPILHIASVDEPARTVDQVLSLLVGAFYQYSLDLRPRKASGLQEGSFSLQVANQSNTELRLKLAAIDPEDGCQYTFTPAQLSLAAGSETPVQLKVQSRQPMVSSQPKTYPFTITAAPTDKGTNAQVQQITGEWERSVAAFEITLYPPKQRGASHGLYNLQVTNRSNSQLSLVVEASDPGAACQYLFNEQRLVLGAGVQRSLSLTVRPKSPLPGETPKTHYFTVNTRLADVEGVSRQATGEWEQIPPAYEMKLLPVSQQGKAAGNFTIQVKNQTDLPLNIQLSAVSPDRDSRYLIEPARLVVAEGKEGLALLKVQSKVRLKKDETKAIPFTVTAQPYEAPALVRQAQGEWTKIGGFGLSGFSIWRYPVAWILLILGWGYAGWMANWPFFMWRDFPGLADYLMYNLNVMDRWAFLISAALYGLVYGILIGLITWLALRIAEPTMPFSRLPAMIFGWMISWGIGITGLLGPLDFGFTSRLYAIFAGLLGGLVTAAACRKIQPKPGLGRAFIIFLAWPLGQFIVWRMLLSGLDAGYYYNASRFDLTGAISSAVAGALTLIILGIPRKD